MKKNRFLVLCIFLFGACSDGTKEEPVMANGAQLVVELRTKTDSISHDSMPGRFETGNLYCFRDQKLWSKKKFQEGESISMNEEAGVYELCAVAGANDDHYDASVIDGKVTIFSTYNNILSFDLFGGYSQINHTGDGKVALELTRLNGGLQINFEDENYWINQIMLSNIATRIVLSDELQLEHDEGMYINFYPLEEIYKILPSVGPLTGIAVVQAEGSNAIEIPFTCKNPILPNQKLVLNLKMNLNVITKAGKGISLVCEEQVEELN